MKNPVPIIFIIIIIASFLPLSVGTQGNRAFEISSLAIRYDKTDAEFIVDYNIGTIPKMYILLMGGKSIAPKIKDVFSNFDYKIVKMDQDRAILHVKNISRFEKGYYLHDSIGFADAIDTVAIYIPGDPRPTYHYGLNATPNNFYSQ